MQNGVIQTRRLEELSGELQSISWLLSTTTLEMWVLHDANNKENNLGLPASGEISIKRLRQKIGQDPSWAIALVHQMWQSVYTNPSRSQSRSKEGRNLPDKGDLWGFDSPGRNRRSFLEGVPKPRSGTHLKGCRDQGFEDHTNFGDK